MDTLNGLVVDNLFLTDTVVCQSVAKGIALLAQKNGPSVFKSGFTDAIIKALGEKKSPAAREGAAQAIIAVAKSAPYALEPVFIDSGLYAALIKTFADKLPFVRVAAVEAVHTFV